MATSRLEQLERLAKLRADDFLTSEEFAAAKARILEEPELEPGYVAERLDDDGQNQPFWSKRGFKIAASVLLVTALGTGALLIVNDFPSLHSPTVAASVASTTKPLPVPRQHLWHRFEVVI